MLSCHNVLTGSVYFPQLTFVEGIFHKGLLLQYTAFHYQLFVCVVQSNQKVFSMFGYHRV